MSNAAQPKPNSVPAALFCVGTPVVFLLILVIPASREIFEAMTTAYPYISGFIKFALLSTAGELLAGAMTQRRFTIPYAVVARAIVWGLLGIVMTVVFKLFGIGVAGILEIGYLPGGQNTFLKALWTSLCMNCIFAPTMMGAHRIFDSWLDLRKEKKPSNLAAAAKGVDWIRYVTFILAKTIPIFWVPAHTVTFLLPEQYRVMLAAFLSIALGAILALASKPSQQPKLQTA